MRDWVQERWEFLRWWVFLGLGLAGGALTYIHPASIAFTLFAFAGIGIFLRMPEIFIPLYVFSGLYKSVVPGPDMTVFFFAAALAAAFFKMRAERETVFLRLNYAPVAAMGLFISFLVFSLVYTASAAPALDKAAKVVTLTLGAFLLPIVLVDQLKRYSRVMFSCVLLGTLMATVSVVTGERSALGSNYLHLGFITGLSILILLFYFLPKGGRKHLVWILPAIIINILGLVNSAARASVLFLPITVVMVVLLSRWKMEKKLGFLFIFLLTGALAVTGLFLLFPENFETLMLRFSVVEDLGNDENARARATYLNDSLELFAEAPVLGVGIGAYGIRSEGIDYYMYPHNILLEIGAELGSIGLILFAALLAATIWHHFSNRQQPAYVQNTMLATAIFGFVTTLKAGSLVENRFFFLFLGLMVTQAFLALETREPISGKGEKT